MHRLLRKIWDRAGPGYKYTLFVVLALSGLWAATHRRPTLTEILTPVNVIDVQLAETFRILRHRLEWREASLYADLIMEAAREYGLEGQEHWLAAQVLIESNGDPRAVGPRTRFGHALGLAQIMPSFWESQCGSDLFDPRTNLYCQARVMRWAMEECDDGHWRCTLNTYWGKDGEYGATKYTRRIERFAE